MKKQSIGSRHNAGKLDFASLSPDILIHTAAVGRYGAQKYPPDADGKDNWKKGLNDRDTFNSLMRHIVKFWCGEDIDSETGCEHLAAIIWNANALLYCRARDLGERNLDTPDPYTRHYLLNIMEGDTDEKNT